MFRLLKSVLKFFLLLGLVTGTLGVSALAFMVWLLSPELPSTDVLKDVHLQTPLRVYTRDGRLMAEFGEKRRIPLRLDEVPSAMVQAVVAAEDERFFQHPGVDWQGLVRAVAYLVRTGEKGPGGSTVTMQVARNFFLGREKTYERKLKEILLALKIERRLSKEEILELYFNKIFFGHRAYGVGAATQVYYGRSLEELKLAQVAMLAGLPKAPSRYNPIVNPQRALARRDYVLGRMLELGFIGAEAHADAVAEPVSAKRHGLKVEIEAPYAAEMVRAALKEELGERAYVGAYRVFTTIDSARQSAANRALRTGLLEYDRRHGYRGPEKRLEDPGGDAQRNESLLSGIPVVGGLLPALVLEVDEEVVLAHAKGFGEIELPWSTLEWARPYIDVNRRGPTPKKPADVVQVGDVIRVSLTEEGWVLSQVPAVEGAFVAQNPRDGAIVALAGGFDYYRSKFNRVTQALRQPGSSFKPFIYSAALQQGFTPASFINDAPVVFEDYGLEDVWRPQNYSGRFFGPTRMRVALYKSRNLVSIRLLKATGIERALEHVARFGIDASRLPANLSLAVGSGEVTPLELSTGYAVIANGGYRVEPYFIERIEDADGDVIRHAQAPRVCRECERAARSGDTVSAEAESAGGAAASGPNWAQRSVDARNVWLMHSMMRDVVSRGTGRRALALGREDLAGKTGTTNNFRDAWFAGFNPGLVAIAWVGFDKHRSLGSREAGSKVALPMWIDFMRSALDGVPEEYLERPEGLVTIRIDPESGEPSPAGDSGAIFETFRAENAPLRTSASAARSAHALSGESGAPEQLF